MVLGKERVHVGRILDELTCPRAAKLCKLAIWHGGGILIGGQGQECPSNEPWRTAGLMSALT